MAISLFGRRKDSEEDKSQEIKKSARAQAEQGTAIDYERIFRSFDNGEVLDTREDPSAKEIQDMIKRDAQAKQLASALMLPIRAAKWDIVPVEGDDGEAEFVRFALGASPAQGGMTTPFQLVLAQIATAVYARAAYFEKVWKVIEAGEHKGKVTLHKLAFRPASTCSLRLDEHGTFDGFIQRAMVNGDLKEIEFDPFESFVYVFNVNENVTGSTPFDTVYRAYVNKLKIQYFYFSFLETVAFPRTIVRVLGDDADQLTVLLQKAKSFGSKGIMGLLEDEEIEPYEAKRTTSDYLNALEWLDWQMAKAVLGQFLDLGTSGERGSFALSKDKSQFFFNALEATLDEIAYHINDYLIPDLIRPNFGKDAAFPKIRFRRVSDEVADKVLEIFGQLLMAQNPNVTPEFMVSFLKRVSEVLELGLDPLADFDEEALAEVKKTIPTPREEMLSRENRAGSGQNPITGKDRNRNNQTPQDQEPGAKDADIVAKPAPGASTATGKRRGERGDRRP